MLGKIEGILLIKHQDAEKSKSFDSFDFRQQDKEMTKYLVDDLDEKIAELNRRRYSLNQNRKRY